MQRPYRGETQASFDSLTFCFWFVFFLCFAIFPFQSSYPFSSFKRLFFILFLICLQNITSKQKLIVCTVQLSWDFEIHEVHLVILLGFFQFSENLTVIAKVCVVAIMQFIWWEYWGLKAMEKTKWLQRTMSGYFLRWKIGVLWWIACADVLAIMSDFSSTEDNQPAWFIL